MTIRAVAFDLDGTLAVPRRDRATLLAEAIDATGVPSFPREAYLDAHRRHLTAESRAPVFADVLADHGCEDVEAAAADLAAAYRRRVSAALDPVPGAESLLADLRTEYRVGLLTNGPVRAQRDKLRALDWDGNGAGEGPFDVSLVTGELDAGKPDERAFASLCAALGTDPGATVYVGNEVRDDVGGAAAAGLYPVQVRYPDGPGPDPRAVAHVERERLADRLPSVLDSL